MTTITITDANGVHTASINDGQDGEDVYVSYNSQEETLIINTMQDGNEVAY